jgi:hypothetical protein
MLEWHCTVASNPELVAEMFVHMVPASAAVFDARMMLILIVNKLRLACLHSAVLYRTLYYWARNTRLYPIATNFSRHNNNQA